MSKIFFFKITKIYNFNVFSNNKHYFLSPFKIYFNTSFESAMVPKLKHFDWQIMLLYIISS